MSGINWASLWASLGEICAVLVTVGAAILVVLKAQLSHYFVTRAEFAPLEPRVTQIEITLGLMPTPAEQRSILDSLAEGRGRFNLLASQIEGVSDSQRRMETLMNMMLQAQLEREKKE